MKEHSLSKSILGTPFHEGFEYLLKNMLPKKHIDIGKSRNALSSINVGIPTIFAYRLAKKKRAGISKLVDEEAVPAHKPRKVIFIVFFWFT